MPFHCITGGLAISAMNSFSFRTLYLRLIAIVAISLALTVTPSVAQQRGVSVVRDAEIEALVSDYARPILQAAGLGKSGIEIVLINDSSFNAFVAGRRIFINTGALMMAETPNEIIGVLAHEAGHIAGGHQQRLRDQLARAQTMSIIASLLGAGAVVAGAATNAEGLAQSGAGIMSGGMEAARRSVLAYQRSEETTADRSAITYLERTGQSARGMIKTFERLAGAMTLSGVRVDPYQISHPVPRERIANLETLARASKNFGRTDSPALQQRHDLMRAKIAAYTQGHGAAMRMFGRNARSVPALYADAIGTFLSGNPRAALSKITALNKAAPKNAYFHEIRGEILIKAGQPEQAAQAFATALRLDSRKSGIIQIGYGQALMATGKPDLVRKAVGELRSGLSRARDYAAGYRYLAQAHGKLGNIGEAELATAEGHYYSGNIRDARIFAARAQQKLPKGTPGWLQAQDIINQKQPRR